MDKELPIAIHDADNAIDKAAQAIGAEVSHHIKTMYPQMTLVKGWASCSRSISGVIRNQMARLGRAAEAGSLDAEIRDMKAQRRRVDALRRAGAAGDLDGVLTGAVARYSDPLEENDLEFLSERERFVVVDSILESLHKEAETPVFSEGICEGMADPDLSEALEMVRLRLRDRGRARGFL